MAVNRTFLFPKKKGVVFNFVFRRFSPPAIAWARERNGGLQAGSKMKIFIETYGCTYNKADSDRIAEELEAKLPGVQFVAKASKADVVIVNSCSVKDATSSKILHHLSALCAAGIRVVACGCLAQTSPELVRKAHPKASLMGTYALGRAADAIEATAKGGRVEFLEKTQELNAPRAFVDGLVARVQIAQGCLGGCNFCSTKIARGNLQSHNPKLLLSEIESAVAAGAKEIQLTAQDTGCFGFDLKQKTSIAELLSQVCKIEGDFRVRLGMLNPQHAKKLRPELLGAFESEKLYKFLHLPVQSGSEKVLKEMKRGHSAKDFELVVRAFREKFPNILIATDLIVGYPTETEEDFLETMELVSRTKPGVCNVSKYSPRPGTLAAKMPLLGNQAVKRRSEKLSALCKKISAENNAGFVGKTARVLVTEKTARGFAGRAENYLAVALARQKGVALGKFANVEITGSGQSHLKAKAV